MAAKNIDALIQTADDEIMAMCAPGKMGQHDALTFLEGLIANLNGAVDALREEMDE